MDFFYNIISIIIGASITFLSSYLLAKKQLKDNKLKLKFEQNLNTLKKLKVNHLYLIHLIKDNYVFNENMTNNNMTNNNMTNNIKTIISQYDKAYVNYIKKLYFTSLKNIKLNNELLDIEIENISDLHSEIINFINSIKNSTAFDTENLDNYNELVKDNILDKIKNIDK